MKNLIQPGKSIVNLWVALAAAMFLGASHSANAQLVTYEGFGYPAASILAGQNGGSGWALNWSIDGSGAATGIIGSSSLSNSVLLATNGQSVTFGNGTIYTRQLANTLGTSGLATTVWVSALFLGGTNATPNESRIGFYGGVGEGTVIDGNTTTTSAGLPNPVQLGRAATGSDVISLYKTTTINSTGVAVPRGLTNAAFLLLKFVMDGTAANDTVSLWVDPDLSPGVGGLGAAQATWTSADLDVINGIRFQAGNAGSFSVDEIRIGKTFDDVTPQVGPYYVTSSGDPCSGSGLTIGVSGSVTTDNYWLYTNGVYTGQSVAGTGSAVDFGLKNIAGNYTVVATNTVTGRKKPMLGSASVLPPGITINTQPSSVSVVTNLPASFTVAATGIELTYQWYKNGVALTNNSNISGATSTNLQIAAAGAADAGVGVAGYTVVVQDLCGTIKTSTPPAGLTLTSPRNLVWVGGSPGSDWNYADLNFNNGSPTAFAPGDNAVFDDSSSFQSVTISNAVIASLVSVTGTKSYTFGGPSKITGVSQLVASSTGTLTIANDNDHIGGTIVNNGATLSIGDGVGVKGSLAGTVTVAPSGTLNYSSAASSINTVINLKNALGGSGTVNFNDGAGATYLTGLNSISSNFTGTINIVGFTRLHASDNNAGNAFGNGSTVNVPANTQAWLDRSATAFNNTFNIAGTGWQGATPNTGAISLFGTVINGPINLLADARIGGTISGGTIQSVISGPYRLEVWGTTNSYVLTLGPTNGSPQAYTSTLITAGAISAANSNALSSGPLSLDVGGDLRVNGNNVTVASLTSINSGQILPIEGARIRNMHATVAGTLTVGTDGSSSQFDGTFSDGAAAAFGLTKVGAGTLTLTAASTNTGPVTVNGGTLALSGSGSFGKASRIIVGSGAFYDVIAAGGTLTLNSGQTLGGSGTVNGNVVANSDATIAPGTSVGTLTVAGNATLGGNMVMELNRSLSPNSDRLVTSGGSITGGGTLTTTNIGPVLQVGNTFQLFAAGVSGITANLQSVDALNGVTYTWNNNIASSGSITVASVTPIAAPTLNVSQTGNSLNFSWTGPFKLQAQTNSLSVGIGSNWGNYPGGSTSPVNVTINPTNPTVFFRLSLQ